MNNEFNTAYFTQDDAIAAGKTYKNMLLIYMKERN
jgi:hypothetical protein